MSDFRFHFISFIIQAKEIIVSCFKLYLHDGCRNVLNNMIDDGGFYLGSVNTFSDRLRRRKRFIFWFDEKFQWN